MKDLFSILPATAKTISVRLIHKDLGRESVCTKALFKDEDDKQFERGERKTIMTETVQRKKKRRGVGK